MSTDLCPSKMIVHRHRDVLPGRPFRGEFAIVLSLIGVALLITLAVVHWSLRHGRLLLPPTYDDVGYLLEGLTRLEVLYHGGAHAFLTDYHLDPPHAPLWVYLASGAFAVFGPHDWAPYAANGLVVLVLLLYVHRLLEGVPWWAEILCLGMVCVAPVTLLAVGEFRPDIAAGLLTAIVAAQILRRPLFLSSRRRQFLIGLCLATALLVKPSVFPPTLLLTGLALVVASVRDRLLYAKQASAVRLARSWAWVLVPGMGLALPHFMLAGRALMRYLMVNVAGEQRKLWVSQMSLYEHLTYFSLGPGGQVMLALHVYIYPTLAAAGLVLAAALRKWRAFLGGLCYGVVLAAAYAGPTLNSVKQAFLAVPFVFLLIFSAFLSVRWMLRGGAGRAAAWGAAGALCLSFLLAGGTAVWPIPLGDFGSQQAIARHRIADDLYQAISSRAVKRGGHVFLTMTGVINADVLRFMAMKNGLSRLYFQSEPMDVRPESYAEHYDDADFVIASGPDNPDCPALFPATKKLAQTLNWVRDRGDYHLIATVPAEGGASYYVFQKHPAFGGFVRSEGLGEEEGPYPQWELPVVRWGVGPRSTLYVSVQETARRRLRLSGQASGKGQRMTITLDGQPIGEQVFDAIQFYAMDVPMILSPGEHRIDLNYAKWDDNPARKAAVLFKRLEVVPDGPQAPTTAPGEARP